MNRELQLPGCLVDVNLTCACLGNAHRPPSLRCFTEPGGRCCLRGSLPVRKHASGCAPRLGPTIKPSGSTARGSPSMPEFAPTELLPLGPDATEYRLLTTDGV